MKKGIRALCKLMKTRNPLAHSLNLCDFTPNSKTQRAEESETVNMMTDVFQPDN